MLCAVCCVLCAVCCVCGAGVPVHAGAAVYESWQDVADSECEECDVAAAVSWVSWAMGSSGVVQQPDYGERESVHAAAAAATDAGSDLRPVFVDGSPQTFQNLDVVEDYDASVTAAMKNDSSAAFLICSISASSVFNKLDASQFPAWFTNYTTCLRWIGFASVGLRTGSNSSFTGSIQLAPVMIDVVRKLFDEGLASAAATALEGLYDPSSNSYKLFAMQDTTATITSFGLDQCTALNGTLTCYNTYSAFQHANVDVQVLWGYYNATQASLQYKGYQFQQSITAWNAGLRTWANNIVDSYYDEGFVVPIIRRSD